MATFLHEFKTNKNNLENRTNNKSFTLEYGRIGSEGRRPNEQTENMPYSYGDAVVIGTLPGGCQVTKLTVLVDEGFDTGTELDIKFSADYPTLAFEDLIQDTVLVDADKASVQTFMAHSGNLNSDGTALSSGDARASVWLGTDEGKAARYIVATFTGGTGELTKGYCDIVVEYNRFGTNEGAF